jgi:hypothetical protein
MTNLEPGQSFGHYTIVSQNAADERGTTYRAYDSVAASDVLLRVLPASLTQAPDFEARFQALGAALHKLAHPNILRVLESGVIDGTPYLAMPNVEVAPLSERLAAGQIAPAQIDRLVTQMAGALQYAQQNGVTHGALSPANVLVDAAGNALLTDFGLDGLRSAATPDPRADVAAVGGLLLTLLTGKNAAVDVATLTEALGQLAASLPADRKAAVAEAYARVAGKLTSANPSERFGSIGEFLSAWQEAGKAAGIAPSITPSTTVAAPMAAASIPPPPTPPAVPPRVTPPPVPGLTAPLSPAAQNLAQRAKALADQAAQVLADQQAAKEASLLGAAQSEAEFAKAKARDDAARAPGTQSSVRDGVRTSLEIAQRMARSTSDPARREALEDIVADLRQIADQRASGQLSEQAAHAAIADLVGKVRQIEAQGAPISREAVKDVATEALSRAQAEARAQAPAIGQAVRRQAIAAARPAVNRAGSFAIGSVGLVLVVCVGLTLVCVFVGSILPDATPTPRPVVAGSQTRPAPTATSRAPTVRATAVPGSTSAPPPPEATAAPLQTTVVFTDTFAADACNLAEGNDARRVLKCEHNEYVMLVKQSTSRWAYYDAPEYQDVVIDLDARAISSAPTMEYGIIWRVSSDGKDFYGFTLKPNGQAAVFVSQNSDFSYFMQGLTVTNFRTGGGINHLTVTAQGTHLSFAVNGEPLALTLDDSALQSGTIGFIVNTTEPNAQAAFSNLTVSEIQ